MKQILAIFVKDARRFWPEILVSFALLTGLVLVYPATWRAPGEGLSVARNFWLFRQGGMGFLAGCLVVLIPISWLVLIARAVHGERLVGNTQFWLTRPYHWPRLLAAKLLYLAVFLYLPFFIAQCVLLSEAGFYPFHYLAGLFFNLFLLTVVGVLPLAALSSVTSGFGRLTLTILGVVLTIVAVAVISNSLPSDVTSSVPDILSGDLGLGAIFCGSLAVVIVMYARRNTKAGWLLIGALTLAMCATAFFDPDRPLIERYYPALTAGSPLPVTITYPAKVLPQPRADENPDRRFVDISVPLAASGVQQGYAVVPVAMKVKIAGANEASWELPWQGNYGAHFLPGNWAFMGINFRMRRSTYDQFKASPVTLRISLAVVEARKSSESAIPLPEGDFAVPEIGVCKPTRWGWWSNEISGIACRSAMNQPQLTFVSAQWTAGDCNPATDANPKQAAGAAWVGGIDQQPAEFGITSVWDVPVPLAMPRFSAPPAKTGSNTGAGAVTFSANTGTPPQRWSLCPGAPLRFTQYRPARRVREEITIPAFRLPEITRWGQFGLLAH